MTADEADVKLEAAPWIEEYFIQRMIGRHRRFVYQVAGAREYADEWLDHYRVWIRTEKDGADCTANTLEEALTAAFTKLGRSW